MEPKDPTPLDQSMKKNEAKFILSALRGDGKEDLDVAAKAALTMAQHDGELKCQFDEQVKFDELMRSRLGDTTVPANLRENILAATSLNSRRTGLTRRQTVGAIAACLISGGLLGRRFLSVPNRTNKLVARFRDDMIAEVEHLGKIDHMSSDPESVSRFLKTADPNLAETEVPATLEGGKLFGCKVLEWNGEGVSLICFVKQEGTRPGLHLLTIKAEALPGFEEGSVVNYQETAWTARVWRAGDNVHLLMEKTLS